MFIFEAGSGFSLENGMTYTKRNIFTKSTSSQQQKAAEEIFAYVGKKFQQLVLHFRIDVLTAKLTRIKHGTIVNYTLLIT